MRFWRPDDICAYNKLLAMDLPQDVHRKITQMIGKHEYVMDSPEDRIDAIRWVQQECPPGWCAGYPDHGQPFFDNAIRVGALVKWGGVSFPLYVYPVECVTAR